MLSSTNFWMCLAGVVYLVAEIYVLQKEIGLARGYLAGHPITRSTREPMNTFLIQ